MYILDIFIIDPGKGKCTFLMSTLVTLEREVYILDVFISDPGSEKCTLWMFSSVNLETGSVHLGCLSK